MKALHEIWNVAEDKIDLVARYPFELRGYTYNHTDIEAFKAMCQKTGTDPRQGEIYPQWDGYRFVPTLTSDGWLRVANEHPEFDGMSINYSEREVTMTIGEATVIGAEFVEVTVHRKDRTHQSSVREYLREAFNELNPTHYTHPNRNTRHKAIAQAVKIAFGISGAYVQGEAEALSAAAPEQGGPVGGQAHVQANTGEQPAAEQQQGQSRRPRVQTKPLDNPPPVTVVEPKAKEEVGAPAQAEADAQVQAEADAQAKAEADAQAKAEADAQAKAEADAQAKAEADAQAKAEADAQAKAEADAQAKAEADAQAKAEADAQAKAKADTEADAEQIGNDVPDFTPTAKQQGDLERFLTYTQSSGQYERAREFLKMNIKDPSEQAWYLHHLDKLVKEAAHA